MQTRKVIRFCQSLVVTLTGQAHKGAEDARNDAGLDQNDFRSYEIVLNDVYVPFSVYNIGK